ncbi:MAG: right-handed parallel beta-helix repeat-containing protein [Candidatus Gracilibacteria bacterium]
MKTKKWIIGGVLVFLVAIFGTYFLNGELLQSRIRLVSPSGTTWYVDTIGGGGGTSITDPMLPGAAILAAASGDKIIFSAGTYMLNDDDIREFVVYITGKELILQGAGIGLTIMDCSSDGFSVNNSSVDITDMTFTYTTEDDDMEDETAIFAYGAAKVNLAKVEIKNFPLQAIYAQGESTEIIAENSYFYNNYQAIHIFNEANGTIRNNKFTKNTNLGLVIFDGTDSIISGNIFTSNRIGAVLVDSNTLVEKNLFENNEWGMNVYVDGGTSENKITKNNFFNSSAAGIVLENVGENSTVTSNVFAKNTIGIYMTYEASSIVTNNIITEQSGDGILLETAQATIAYNTIANSRATGISSIESDSSYIVNNILFRNGTGVLVDSTSTAVELGYNDLYGNTTDISGTYADLGGNRYDDPGFTFRTPAIFELTSTSPLIDQAGLYFVDYDFEGATRTTPDIGAYEY